MPRQTAIASASGLVAGIAITLASTGGLPDHPKLDLLLHLLTRTAPAVCALLIAGKVFRRWLDNYTADARRDLAEIAEQRRLFHVEVQARLDYCQQREEAFRRGQQATDSYVRVQQAELVATKEEVRRLQAEFDDLAADYNRVVTDTLQQSAHRFRPRPGPNSTTTAGIAIPLPARVPARVGDTTHERARDADPCGT
ncbi:hypothetical protein ABZ593_21305 [Streptomyces sp. NPDC012617]|uniref:hypothetical protein n=1 Tax=Streptomyces TaxID=1883 RepID=UPI0034013E0A